MSIENNKDIVIGVLTPKADGPMPPPSKRPISQALRKMESRGVKVIFGDTLEKKRDQTIMNGVVINSKEDKWERRNQRISALHDRFPSQRRHHQYKQTIEELAIPMSNPYAITMLCRDKLMVQEILESGGIKMPPVTGDPALFKDCITKWQHAFIKPRFGALGKNISEKQKEDKLESHLEGMVPGRLEPTILQKSILAPKGWGGLSVRLLCQRVLDSWALRTPVLRRSRADRVVNVSRGAEALVAEEALPKETMASIYSTALEAITCLENTQDGQWMVEIGIDFVIDHNYRPWLIEINSRPRGRLEFLAKYHPERFQAEHQSACLAPIEWLAWKSKH